MTIIEFIGKYSLSFGEPKLLLCENWYNWDTGLEGDFAFIGFGLWDLEPALEFEREFERDRFGVTDLVGENGDEGRDLGVLRLSYGIAAVAGCLRLRCGVDGIDLMLDDRLIDVWLLAGLSKV